VTNGYYTTGDIATAASVTINTVVGWLEAGLLDGTVTETGRRRVAHTAMRRVEDALTFAGRTLDHNAPPGTIVGGYLRWLKRYPVPTERPELAAFLCGFISSQHGPDVHAQERLPRGAQVQALSRERA
jgi:hypothetical protein